MIKSIQIMLLFCVLCFVASPCLFADVKPTPTPSLKERVLELEKKADWDWLNYATGIAALLGLFVKIIYDSLKQRTSDLQLVKDLLPNLTSGGHRETNTALSVINALGKHDLRNEFIKYFAEVRPGFLASYLLQNPDIQGLNFYKKRKISEEGLPTVTRNGKDYLEYNVVLGEMYHNHGSGLTKDGEWCHFMKELKSGEDIESDHLYGPYKIFPKSGKYFAIFELKAETAKPTEKEVENKFVCGLAVDTNEGQNRLAGIRLVEKSEIKDEFQKIELPFDYCGQILEFRLHHCAAGTIWCKSITIRIPVKK